MGTEVMEGLRGGGEIWRKRQCSKSRDGSRGREDSCEVKSDVGRHKFVPCRKRRGGQREKEHPSLVGMIE